MDKARQDSDWPTRKAAIAASIAGIVSPLSMIVAFHYGPDVLPPHIAEAYGMVIYTAVSAVLSIAFAITPHIGGAWYVHDRPNIPMNSEEG